MHRQLTNTTMFALQNANAVVLLPYIWVRYDAENTFRDVCLHLQQEGEEFQERTNFLQVVIVSFKKIPILPQDCHLVVR